MKKNSAIKGGLLSIVVLAAAFSGFAEDKLFLDENFKDSQAYLERWNWNAQKVKFVDGKVQSNRGHLKYTGMLPTNYRLEFDYTLMPDFLSGEDREFWNKQRGGNYRSGVYLDEQMIQTMRGSSFLLAHETVRYTPFDGYEDGKPVHFRIERRLSDYVITYGFWLNNTSIATWTMPRPDAKKLEEWHVINFGDAPFELSHVKIYELEKVNPSPNGIYNASFEVADEDGLPIFYNWYGGFKWATAPFEAYDDFIVNRVIDKTEKHSGQQSLKCTISPHWRVSFSPYRPPTDPSRSGVFSLWAKTDIPGGIDVGLRWGEGQNIVHVDGKTWKRYECYAELQPKKDKHRSTINVWIENPKGKTGHVWFDDLQSETIKGDGDAGEAKLTESFDENEFESLSLEDKPVDRPRATPFRLSDRDEGMLDITPRESPAKTEKEIAAENKIEPRGTFLAHLDYYVDGMDENAEWRVHDGKGGVEIAKVPLKDIPMGTNEVEFATLGEKFKDTVIKLPKPEDPGTAQRNFWLRCVRLNGKDRMHISVVFLFSRDEMPVLKRRLDYIALLGFNSLHASFWPSRSSIPKYREVMEYWTGKGEEYNFSAWTDGVYPEKPKEKEPDKLTEGDVNELTSDTSDLPDFKIKHFINNEDSKRQADEATLKERVELFDGFRHRLIANQVADELDGSVPGEDAKGLILNMKRFFPYHPVYFNNTCMIFPYGNYADNAQEIFMVDTYLTSGHHSTVYSQGHSIDNMMVTQEGKPVFYFTEVELGDLHYRVPSFREQIAMSWTVVLAGCRGIAYYIGVGFTKGTHDGIVLANKEIHSFDDVILSEEWTRQAIADCSKNAVRHRTFKKDGALYILSCSVSEVDLEKVTFTLPPEAPRNGIVEVLGENRTIELKDGQFSDSYVFSQRHFYKVGTGNP